MRILQLIDSLDAGGAERMAVNYANALYNELGFSALCTTRKEGVLKNAISCDVDYLFLRKKGTFDFEALLRLKQFIKKNKIDILHAHSTSFILAVLLKLVYPKIKIVWHDHFGGRFMQSQLKNLPLKFVSIFFYKVLTINEMNHKWLSKALFSREIKVFPNFISSQETIKGNTKLNGIAGKRIVFLANLRNPKNHLQFLKAFKKSQATILGWTLHLIGKDYEDEYSQAIKDFIYSNNLEEFVYIYGGKTDTYAILSQAQIGVLCSTHEGFPVTLLEYGYMKLGILTTNVGFCSQIIKNGESGFLFQPNDLDIITKKLDILINNKDMINSFGEKINKFVQDNYVDQIVIKSYLQFLLTNKNGK